MILTRLEAISFRNLTGTLRCETGLNFLIGDNGQGKTNWLEAIYLLGSTKSFKTNHLQEVIEHNSSEAILRGAVRQGTIDKELQAQFQPSAKSFYVNGKREAPARYLGNLDVFAFTNEELAIIRGEPAERRRFLDRGIAAVNPSYIRALTDYNRVLKQKVALLKDAQESEDYRKFIPLIEPWNEQLAELGAQIHLNRVKYVEQLANSLQAQLFGKELVTIRYKSALESHGDLSDYETVFRQRLVARLPNEISLGYTLVGPHRDDLIVEFDGYEMSRFGSAGQQRSALLILVLAQVSLYNDELEEYPIFLLDDIDAELDLGRIKTLLNYLEGKTQTFISTSKRNVTDWHPGRFAQHRISAGRVEKTREEPDFGESLRSLPQAHQPPF